MIGMLTGIVINNNRNPIIINVNGVGYNVYVSSKIISSLINNSTSTLYIHTHVREDALELFGFKNSADLDLFNLLLTVSGVGPKTALLVLDKGTDQIIKAITTSDVDFFTSIPRLGRKNSQKIIIELKSKLGSITDLNLTELEKSEESDLIDALQGMGFEKREIINIIKKIDLKNMTIQDKIRTVLRYVNKK